MGNHLLVLTIIFWVLAVLVSALGTYVKVKVLPSFRKLRTIQFASVQSCDAYTQKHVTRKSKAKKTLRLCCASLLAGLLEDLPLGCIGLRFVQLSANHPGIFGQISFLVLLSTASSFLQLGVKLSKLPLLKVSFYQRRKEKSKVTRSKLGKGCDDLQEWLKHIPNLSQYANMFTQAGITGEQLVAVMSDTELINLGMEQEIDRKYLLLQLARVRARTTTLAQWRLPDGPMAFSGARRGGTILMLSDLPGLRPATPCDQAKPLSDRTDALSGANKEVRELVHPQLLLQQACTALASVQPPR